jgi:hypothetical protein
MTIRRVRVLTMAAIGLVIAVASGSASTLAAFTHTDSATSSITADTLAPPTGLAATGGSDVALTWTPTVDLYAIGYSVWRAGVSGGPYSAVGSVTPRTAAAASDAPGTGTWFYVLRSTAGSWSSLDSNEASATVGVAPTSTAYGGCASQAADTTGAGDNDGYQTTPGNACTDGGGSALDPNTGSGGAASCGSGAIPDPANDRHRFWGYATDVPVTASSIAGIRVRADLAVSNNGGTTNLCAQLSWDGGTSWTALKSIAVAGTGETTYVFGGTTDTWGRTWTTAELDPTKLRVRIVNATTQTNKRFELDYLALSVTYDP